MPLFEPAKAKKQLPPTDKWSVTVERNFCKACRFCIDVCPVDVFAWSKEVNSLGWFPIEVAHEANCVGCMLCYQVCPDFVINVESKPSRGRDGLAGCASPSRDQDGLAGCASPPKAPTEAA